MLTETNLKACRTNFNWAGVVWKHGLKVNC